MTLLGILSATDLPERLLTGVVILQLLLKSSSGLVMTLLGILSATDLPERLLTGVVILQLLLRVINLKATSSLLLLPSLLPSLLLVPEGARGRNKQTKEQWEGTKMHGW